MGSDFNGAGFDRKPFPSAMIQNERLPRPVEFAIRLKRI